MFPISSSFGWQLSQNVDERVDILRFKWMEFKIGLADFT